MRARVSAFTLIELLVVVVLVGILVVIAAPDYLKFRQRVNLQGSIDVLQTGFDEAFSLSRSRSEHFLIRAQQGNDYFEILACTNFDCTIPGDAITDSFRNPNQRELEGLTTFASADFEVHFLAPHGDLVIAEPAGADPLALSLDNRGLTADLNVFPRSGLVTTDTP